MFLIPEEKQIKYFFFVSYFANASSKSLDYIDAAHALIFCQQYNSTFLFFVATF
jgi:hypothetical protein